MPEFPEQLPHGLLEEVLPDIFVVKGLIRIEVDQTHEFSRNMTVIRDGDALTLINTIRLDDAGLAALDVLGSVRHIAKLGAFHGRDDAFYIDRYGADLWAPEGMTYSRGEKTGQTMRNGETGPTSDSTSFVFDTPKAPEAILHLSRHTGVLVTCDSFQSASGPDEYFNEVSAESKRRLGFFGRPVIGPGWRKAAEPEQSDYEQLLNLNFRHMFTGHGEPVLEDAHDTVQALITNEGIDT